MQRGDRRESAPDSTRKLDGSIDQSRRKLREAQVRRQPEHAIHRSLADGLVARYRECGDADDLIEAIEHYQTSLDLLSGQNPGAERLVPAYLILVDLLFERCALYGDAEAGPEERDLIDKLVRICDEVTRRVPSHAPLLGEWQWRYSRALRTRFRRCGSDVADLRDAVNLALSAFAAANGAIPGESRLLVAAELETLYWAEHKTEYLDKAIELLESAFDNADEADRSRLALLYGERHRITSGRPMASSDRTRALEILSQLHGPTQIDEVGSPLDQLRQIVALFDPADPARVPWELDLVETILERPAGDRSPDLLDEALGAVTAAFVTLAGSDADTHALRVRMLTLHDRAALDRHRLDDQWDGLTPAIERSERQHRALRNGGFIPPEVPAGLADLYLARFRCSAPPELRDIERAIDYCSQAKGESGPRDREDTDRRRTLALAYVVGAEAMLRLAREPAIEWLTASQRAQGSEWAERAVAELSDVADHDDRPAQSEHLLARAKLALSRFTGDRRALLLQDEARQLWEGVLGSDDPLAAVEAASALADLHRAGGYPVALPARSVFKAVLVVREHVLNDPRCADKDAALHGMAGLGSLAVELYKPQRRMRAEEKQRCWADAILALDSGLSLDLVRRTGLNALEVDAVALDDCGDKDLAAAARALAVREVDPEQVRSLRRRTTALAERRPGLVLSPWLRRPSERDLTEAAHSLGGPIVYLVAGEDAGTAMWATEDERFGGCDLPLLNRRAARDVIDEYHRAARDLADAMTTLHRVERRFGQLSDAVDRAVAWCREVTEPLHRKPELRRTDRLGLVPPVGLPLPFVAALNSDDRWVVTFAPCAAAVRGPGPTINQSNALVVAHPGSPPLAYASAEARLVAECYHNVDKLIAELDVDVPSLPSIEEIAGTLSASREASEDDPAGSSPLMPPVTVRSGRTVDDGALADKVVELLGAVNMVHLACHGRWDPDDPMKSHLALDRPLSVGEIMAQVLDKRPHVVLSACDTALVGGDLAEQQVGLPTALLAAGAASVVASLWPVSDNAGPHFMRDYHREVANGADPALALARTQQTWQKAGRPALLWANWVHVGPSLRRPAG